MKEHFHSRYLMVLLSCCGMSAAALGMLSNVSGVFFTPIADDLGIGRGLVSMTLTIANLAMAAGGLLAGKLINRFGFKRILITAALLFAGNTAALAIAPGIAILYILNAIRGFAAGLAGTVLVTMIINSWFVKNSGTFTSLALAASGIIGAFFSPVFSAVIEQTGWRTAYLVTAGIIFLLELPAIILPIDIRPEAVGFRAYGDRREGRDREPVSRTAGGPKGRPEWDGTKKRLFLLAVIYTVTCAAAPSYTQHLPGIAQSYGFTAAAGSLMISVGLASNTCGKLVFGFLTDRIGVRRAIVIFGAFLFSGVLLLIFTRVEWACFIAAGCIGLSYALAAVGTVLYTKDLFGIEEYNRVYPFMSLCMTASSAVSASVVGFVYDASGSYRPALIMLLVLLGIMFASVFAAPHREGRRA